MRNPKRGALPFWLESRPLPERGYSTWAAGWGDFRLWLLCHGIAVDYHGIDIAPRMVEAAKNRQPDAVGLSVQGHPPTNSRQVAVTITCWQAGIFCFRKNEPLEDMRRTVEAMFRLCERGVAFNSLSLWRGDLRKMSSTPTRSK